MDNIVIKKALSWFHRLFFVLACVAITSVVFIVYLGAGLDADQARDAMNVIVGLLFLAGGCQIVRDFLPVSDYVNKARS